MEVNIQVCCTAGQTQIEAFQSLLQELSVLVGTDSLSSLTTIFIVDAEQLVSTIRQIITHR